MSSVSRISTMRIAMSYGPELSFLVLLRMLIGMYRPDIVSRETRVKPTTLSDLRNSYDFIIIGGGTAGSVLANRLSENENWTVLLLEAGVDENDLSDIPILFPILQLTSMDWQFKTEPSNNYCKAMKANACNWPRGKVLGGSSVLNAMLYVRGNKKDYDNWQEMGNPGWDYESVLPYFKKSEDMRIKEYQDSPYHRTGGYLTVEYFNYRSSVTDYLIQAGTEMGYDVVDVNGPTQTGFSFSHATVKDGLRCSTAKAFLRTASKRKNLHISMRSMVERILVSQDENGKTAYGVEFQVGSRRRTVKASREVILSAGAIQSPQLLMLSGIGPRGHLEQLDIPVVHEAPGVGRNLQDHVAIGGLTYLVTKPANITDSTSFSFNLMRSVNAHALNLFVRERTGPLYGSNVAEGIGFINTKYANKSEDYPDIQLFVSSTADNTDGGLFGKRACNLLDDFYARLFENILYQDSYMIMPLLLRPRSRGYIKLRSKDVNQRPIIVPNYFDDPHDLDVLFQASLLDTSNGTSCCSCSFKDTSYMASKCGVKTSFMSLVEKIIASTCDVSDPCHRLGKEEVPNEWFDFIVVGGGVAGPVIARRLSDNPWWRVLLIEAGPEEPSMTSIPGLAVHAVNSTLDWNFKTEPTEPHPTACLETDGVCTWPRGKMMSGTAGMYGMMYVRGHPEVYNSWARAGATGWSYDEVAHYFERAEDPVDPSILSDKPRSVAVPGPMKIRFYPHKPAFADELLKAAAELGYRTSNLKEYSQTGFMVAPMTTDNGVRGTTSRNYLRSAYGKNNLRVLINAQVTKVLTNQWQSKAYGVELIDKDGYKRIVKANKEVILAAGAIGSPHILLNSGIGPKEHLTKLGMNVIKDLPVGKNLHNHVSVAVLFSIKDTAYESMNMNSVNEYLETRTGPLSSTGLTQVTAFLESSYAASGVPDIQMFFDGFAPNCPRTGLEFECLNGALGLCSDRRQIVVRPTAVTVESRGYMKLRSGDPIAPPLIYPNYFTHTKDLKVLIEGIRKAIELTNTQTMKQWDFRLEPIVHPLCTNYHFATDAYWECYVRAATGPENHQSGTCKVGAYDDPTAVVDPELRVRGISNIRVADASVFPIVPNSNPIAAIMMIAEKAADMITHTWSKM